MSSVAQIVSGIRVSIGDEKTKEVHIVKEPLGISNGTTPETFYTKNMPLVSGNDIWFRGGRWSYIQVSTAGAANGIRGFLFTVTGGSFQIPNGALPVTSGDTAWGSYSYTQEQEYEYLDSELFEYVRDGFEWFQTMRGLGLVGAGVGTGYSISPEPNAFQSTVISMAAKYMLSKDREELGFTDGIMIKELDITIDTTKGSKNRIESSKQLKETLKEIANRLNMGDTASAAGLVDTYSTFRSADSVGLNYETNASEGSVGLGEGIE